MLLQFELAKKLNDYSIMNKFAKIIELFMGVDMTNIKGVLCQY